MNIGNFADLTVQSTVKKESGEKKLKGSIYLDISNSNKIYQTFQTPKKLRKKMKSISFNFNIRPAQNKFILSNFLLDNKKIEEEKLLNLNNLLTNVVFGTNKISIFDDFATRKISRQIIQIINNN